MKHVLFDKPQFSFWGLKCDEATWDVRRILRKPVRHSPLANDLQAFILHNIQNSFIML